MAKLFGCPLNVEGGGGGGSSIAGEVSRSGFHSDGEGMSLSVRFPPERNPHIRFVESNSDSGTVCMDSEADLHTFFIDFFDRESNEVDTVAESYRGPNQRLSTPCGSSVWGCDDMEEAEIELGLGIGAGSGSGSGSGQVGGDSGLQVTENKEIDSGRVEVGTEVAPVWDDVFGVEVSAELYPFEDDLFGYEEVMMADLEREMEDLQNAITWVSEPAQASVVSLEEEEEDEEEGGEEEEEEEEEDEEEEEEEEGGGGGMELDYLDVEWESMLLVNNDDLAEDAFEERLEIMVESDLMDLDYGAFLATIDELGEDDGEYENVLAQTFEQEPGIMGRLPALRKAVDDLPVVEITPEDLSNGNIVCAICIEEIGVEERVKRLPCRHHYHGECIGHWFAKRNTCPVCRYELPTDDLEYEWNKRYGNRLNV